MRKRIELSRDEALAAPRQAQLVFIGYHPSRPRVVALLRDITGAHWS